MSEQITENSVASFISLYLEKLEYEELKSITKQVMSKLADKLKPESDMDCFWELITNTDHTDQMSDEEKKAIVCMMPLAYKAKSNLIMDNAL